MARPEQHNLAGITLTLTSVGLLTAMDSVAKWLVGADYSVMQILALRGWLIAAVMVAMLFLMPRLGGPAALKTARPGGHLLRVAIGFFAPYLFFSALKTMPLADTTVIFFGGATFLMTALSVPLFKERVGIHRWGAVCGGFIGVVIAAQPSGAVFRLDALYALGSGAAYAFYVLSTRWLGSSEGTFRQVFYFNLGLAVIGSTALPFVFVAMPPKDSGILVAMAALAVGGHYCLVRAFNLAPVGLLAPFEYSAMVWAAMYGFVFWGDIPENPVLLGASIVVASGLYLAHRETLAARSRKKDTRETLLVADPVPVVIAVESEDA